jgi:hypothetical protein
VLLSCFEEKPALSIDEEWILLDSFLGRLKIEHEIFFSNPIKRPPTDLEGKVLGLQGKFSDGSKTSFAHNEMARRYAICSDRWRKKSRIRERGYRRPARSVSPSTVCAEMNTKPATPVFMASASIRPGRRIRRLLDPGAEREKSPDPYKVLVEAKSRQKEGGRGVSHLRLVFRFVSKKTKQIPNESGCHSIEYTADAEPASAAQGKATSLIVEQAATASTHEFCFPPSDNPSLDPNSLAV